MTSTILDQILATKRQEVRDRRAKDPESALLARIDDLDPCRDFAGSLNAAVEQGNPGVIAEIKKASPSAGVLRDSFDPSAIAKSYESAGASCLSVLTDAEYFQGHEDYLVAARDACALPVLRKEFIVDPWQVLETRALGADAILLIVAALSREQLIELADAAATAALHCLVEVHDEDELAAALDLETRLIGVNNRNLKTFETRIDTTLRLASQVGEDRQLITESGIRTRDDVSRLRDSGIHRFLVGEAFMRAPDPGAQLRTLFR